MAIIVNGLFVGLNIICLYSKTDMTAVFELSYLLAKPWALCIDHNKI